MRILSSLAAAVGRPGTGVQVERPERSEDERPGRRRGATHDGPAEEGLIPVDRCRIVIIERGREMCKWRGRSQLLPARTPLRIVASASHSPRPAASGAYSRRGAQAPRRGRRRGSGPPPRGRPAWRRRRGRARPRPAGEGRQGRGQAGVPGPVVPELAEEVVHADDNAPRPLPWTLPPTLPVRAFPRKFPLTGSPTLRAGLRGRRISRS